MINESEVKTIVKFIKDSVEFLKKEDCGCCHRSYDGDLCLVVGWMPGYSEEKDATIIQSKSQPNYAINAGVKLLVSAMQTDMDLDFNYLYWDNGDCWDCTTAVSPNEDYEALAESLLKEAEEMSKYKYDKDGRILGHKSYFELCETIADELDSKADKEDFEIMSTRIANAAADLTEDEYRELTNRLQTAFYVWAK